MRRIGLWLLALTLLACTPQAPSAQRDPGLPSPAVELKPSLRYLDKASPQFAWESSAPLRLLMDRLGLKPGSRVLILGSGSGYFEYPIAKRVGATGRVLSLTENSIHSDLLNQRSAALGLGWFSSRFVTWEGSGNLTLDQGSFDLCLWFNSFNLLAPRPQLITSLQGALAPDGRLAVFSPRLSPQFGLDSNWSPAFVAGVFRVMGKDFPLLAKLPADLRTCLIAALDQPDPALEQCLDRRFLAALNDLRKDSSVFFALQAWLPWVQYYSEMGQRVSNLEMVRLAWLMYRLPEVVDLNDEAAVQGGPEVETLNTVLLASLFSIDNPGAEPEDGSYSWHLFCSPDCAANVLAPAFAEPQALDLFSDFELTLFRRLN